MAKYREINWDYWRNLTGVEPWEACALSLDIDPDTMWSDRQGYLVGPGALPMYEPQPNNKTIETLVEFNVRLNRLHRYIHNRESHAPAKNGKLPLAQFVEWLRALGIDHIPLALAELRPTPEEQAQWNRINTWLDENPDIPRRLSRLLDMNNERPTPTPTESGKPEPIANSWIARARIFGIEEFGKHPNWTLDRIAQEVARRLGRDQTYGRGGRVIRWETVRRHALTRIKGARHSGIAPTKLNASDA